MGMLVDGVWHDQTDRFMVNGVFQRETSPFPSQLNSDLLDLLQQSAERFVLVASASCPWSHGAVIAAVLCGYSERLQIQWAGGPRIKGYSMLPDGSIAETGDTEFVYELYLMTDSRYTGRATVPVLWDQENRSIISNSSADIIAALVQTGSDKFLVAEEQTADVEELVRVIFDGLSNAVYRAGLAETQMEYDAASDLVFKTMDELEQRLGNSKYLFGSHLTVADVRLFATLVRFDTVYATHFRCTRKRLVDYPALWRFTRQIYQLPGIKETIDFDEIRFGYYVNDGSHNPHNIIGQQPIIDWENKDGLLS